MHAARLRVPSLVFALMLVATACHSSATMDADAAMLPPDGDAPDAAPDGDVRDAGPDGEVPDGGSSLPPCEGADVFCGELRFGRVTGLAFATETLSGLTDTQGTFRYRAGETVTFAIGGTTLGSAAAAPFVSLFDLVGIAPPSTEASLRAELHDDLDVTAFDRVANTATLLLSLDRDLNPRDGVELEGWDTTLADETIPLDAPLYHFGRRSLDRVGRRYGVHRTVLVATSLAHLYDAIDVVVPAHVRTAWHSIGGISEARSRYEHDALGRAVARFDVDEQGVDIWAERVAYDSVGRVLEHRTEMPVEEGWRIVTIEANAYDAFGRVVVASNTADWDFDGVFDQRVRGSYFYDTRGNRTNELVSFLDGRVTEAVSTFDALGNLVMRTDEDDVRDLDAVSVRTYDDAGDLVRDVLTSRGPGGTVRVEHVYVYASAGRVATHVTDTDIDGDTVVDQHSERTYTYAPEGWLRLSVEHFAIGTSNETRATRTLDAEGRPLVERTERGPMLRNHDVSERTYAANGERIAWRIEQLVMGVSTTVTAGTDAYVYAPEGYEIERVHRSDGAIAPVVQRVTSTYAPIADGLVALIYAYDPEREL